MKKLLFLFTLFLVFSLSINAQNRLKIAIVDLKAGVGRTQSQVDGLSDMLTASLFETGRFTIVERTQVNKIMQERRIKSENLSNTDIRTLGNILEIDALLIGTINFIVTDRTLVDVITEMSTGEYNVDVRLVSVLTGEILSAAGGNQYGNQTERNLMRTIANELTENLIISISGSNNKEVIILYDYLYVYPEDLGKFTAMPQTIINSINRNNIFGFNDWRLPTADERDLLQANRHRLGLLNNTVYAHNNSFSSSGSYSVRLVRTGVLVQRNDPTPSAITYIEKTTHDFGTVPVLQGSVTTTFIVQNPTRSELNITNVQTNASWITADWVRTAISPGDSRAITIRMNINGRQRTNINRNIIVTLSNGERLNLNIIGYVE